MDLNPCIKNLIVRIFQKVLLLLIFPEIRIHLSPQTVAKLHQLRSQTKTPNLHMFFLFNFFLKNSSIEILTVRGLQKFLLRFVHLLYRT